MPIRLLRPIYLSISWLILAPDHTPLYPKTIQEKCWGQSPKILLVSLYESISLTLNSRSFLTKKRPSASKWWILLELTPVLLAHLPRQMPWTITENPKGQIISEWLLDVFIWTKNRTKIFLYFCPSSRDIHIECSKQFKWILCLYGSGQSGPFWAELKLLKNSSMAYK